MRQSPGLLAALRLACRFNRPLADELVEFCFKKKRDFIAEFITGQDLPREVVEAWTSDEAQSYMDMRRLKLEAELAEQVRAKAQAKIDEKAHVKAAAQRAKVDEAAARRAQQVAEQEFERDLAIELIDPRFKATFEGNYQPYVVLDLEQEILEPTSPMNLGDMVAHAIKDEMREHDYVLDTPTLNRFIDYWRLHCPRIEAPKLRRRMDEPGWCLSRPTIRPDPTVPCPTWDSFFDRLNDPDAGRAYVGGMYYHLNPKGRQVLCITDFGQTGKTQWLLALTRLMGENVTKSINHEQLKGKHFTAAFARKVFAIVPDNMNPKIIMTGAFKEITGHDRTSVEAKYQNPIDVEIQCKGIIIGNVEPDISHERSNQTRTLWLKQSPIVGDVDPDWGDRLDAEAPGMLAKCLAAFHARCKDGYHIEPNDVVKAAMAAKVREFEERHQHVFDKFFVLDPKGRLDRGVLYEILSDRRGTGPGWSDNEIANFKRWLAARHDIYAAHDNGQHFYPGTRLKRHNDHLNGVEDPYPQPPTPDLMAEIADIADFADEAEFC